MDGGNEVTKKKKTMGKKKKKKKKKGAGAVDRKAYVVEYYTGEESAAATQAAPGPALAAAPTPAPAPAPILAPAQPPSRRQQERQLEAARLLIESRTRTSAPVERGLQVHSTYEHGVAAAATAYPPPQSATPAAAAPSPTMPPPTPALLLQHQQHDHHHRQQQHQQQRQQLQQQQQYVVYEYEGGVDSVSPSPGGGAAADPAPAEAQHAHVEEDVTEVEQEAARPSGEDWAVVFLDCSNLGHTFSRDGDFDGRGVTAAVRFFESLPLRIHVRGYVRESVMQEVCADVPPHGNATAGAEEMRQFLKTGRVISVPRGKDFATFLVDKAMQDNAFLVTNARFRAQLREAADREEAQQRLAFLESRRISYSFVVHHGPPLPVHEGEGGSEGEENGCRYDAGTDAALLEEMHDQDFFPNPDSMFFEMLGVHGVDPHILSPPTPEGSVLATVVLDGANLAFTYGRDEGFDVEGIQATLAFFRRLPIPLQIVVFVPQGQLPDPPSTLHHLYRRGVVSLVPAGDDIAAYVLEAMRQTGGFIVTNARFRRHIDEVRSDPRAHPDGASALCDALKRCRISYTFVARDPIPTSTSPQDFFFNPNCAFLQFLRSNGIDPHTLEERSASKEDEVLAVIVLDGANLSYGFGESVGGGNRHSEEPGVFDATGLVAAFRYFTTLPVRVIAFLPEHYVNKHTRAGQGRDHEYGGDYPDNEGEADQGEEEDDFGLFPAETEAVVTQSGLIRRDDRQQRLLHKLHHKRRICLVPAGDDDDAYFIEAARQTHGFVVTDDKLRDHVHSVATDLTAHPDGLDALNELVLDRRVSHRFVSEPRVGHDHFEINPANQLVRFLLQNGVDPRIVLPHENEHVRGAAVAAAFAPLDDEGDAGSAEHGHGQPHGPDQANGNIGHTEDEAEHLWR